jgi:hypothetical protein
MEYDVDILKLIASYDYRLWVMMRLINKRCATIFDFQTREFDKKFIRREIRIIPHIGHCKVYSLNQNIHRFVRPAVKFYSDTLCLFWSRNFCRLTGNKGDRHYYQNGRLHRVDGPAMEHSNGNWRWYKNGLCHRENGPSMIIGSAKYWCIKGNYHRLDGPAIEKDDYKEYWVNGKKMTQFWFYIFYQTKS